MCCGCWKEAGSPKIDSESVFRLAALTQNIDEFGHLHIIVDDMNVEDSHIDMCAKSVDENSKEESANERQQEREYLQLMRTMTVSERYSALGLADGCWKPDGMWWCNSHQREATHVDEHGEHECDANLGGITLPCRVVFAHVVIG